LSPPLMPNERFELRVSVFVVKLEPDVPEVVEVPSRIPCSCCISVSSAVALESEKLSNTFFEDSLVVTLS